MKIVRIGLFFQLKNYEKYHTSMIKKNINDKRLEIIFQSLNELLSKYDFKILRMTFNLNKVIIRIANNLNGKLYKEDDFYKRYNEPYKYIKDIEFFCNLNLREYRIYISDSEFIPNRNKIIFDKINKIILKALYFSQVDKYVLV